MEKANNRFTKLVKEKITLWRTGVAGDWDGAPMDFRREALEAADYLQATVGLADRYATIRLVTELDDEDVSKVAGFVLSLKNHKIKPEDTKGLYPKYCVMNNATGAVVEDCFVLGTRKDRAARLALLYYSDLVKDENPQLSAELKFWILGIEAEEAEK